LNESKLNEKVRVQTTKTVDDKINEQSALVDKDEEDVVNGV
jgi:hypothetical protein